MDFLKHIKLHTLKHLILAKDRDEMRGMIEAEKDLEGVLMSITKFETLVAYMKNQFVGDAEIVIFGRLLETKDKIEEKRMIAQLKHTKKLQKQFMQYVKNAHP